MSPNVLRHTVAALVVLCIAVVQAAIAIAAPPADSCALLTQAQASAALGVPVGAGKSLVPTVCQWEQPGKPGEELLKLDVNVVTVERFNRMNAVSLGTITPAGGLGDDAYYATMKVGRTTNTTLSVKKGDTAVTIRVWGGAKPVDEYQSKEKAVAQAILPKL
jgi:hypothetical protein